MSVILRFGVGAFIEGARYDLAEFMVAESSISARHIGSNGIMEVLFLRDLVVKKW